MKIKPLYENVTITPLDCTDMETPKTPDTDFGMGKERKTLRLRFRVVTVGPGRYNPEKDKYVAPIVKPGDIIILADSDQAVREFWAEHEPVYCEGLPLLFTDEQSIHAIVEE